MLHGELKPYQPELNFPLVEAIGNTEQVIAIYNIKHIIDIDSNAKKVCYIVNATLASELHINCINKPIGIELFDTCGKLLPAEDIPQGLSIVHVPCSGLLKLIF